MLITTFNETHMKHCLVTACNFQHILLPCSVTLYYSCACLSPCSRNRSDLLWKLVLTSVVDLFSPRLHHLRFCTKLLASAPLSLDLNLVVLYGSWDSLGSSLWYTMNDLSDEVFYDDDEEPVPRDHEIVWCEMEPEGESQLFINRRIGVSPTMQC